MALNEHDMSGAERDARLDRIYAHIGRDEPPAQLDAAIRAAARRAVGARPHALGARLRRWGVPISVAAVVVVSVSLVTVMREQGAGRLDESYSPAPAEPKAAPPREPEAAQFRAQDRVEPAGRPDVASPPAASAPAARTASPAPTAHEASPSSADEPLRGRGLAEPSGARLRPAEEAGNMALPEQREADRAIARQAAPGREVLGKKKAETRAGDDVPASPPAALRSAPALADEKPMSALTQEKSERPLTRNQFDSLVKELDKAPPKSWLEAIERLRREGRGADADALLDEFARRFPEHPMARQAIERAR